MIVYWEEVANGAQTDVVATWTGSMTPGTFEYDNARTTPTPFTYTDDESLAGFSNAHDVWSGGTHASGLGLLLEIQNYSFEEYAALVSPDITFGFGGGLFYYAGAEDKTANNTTINFDDTIHSMTFPNRTLTDMNANSFSDTLAWTSSSGDTISYTSGSPSPVSAIPEPSSGLVLGFLLLSGLIHRRRK